jgi:hypothetical protein
MSLPWLVGLKEICSQNGCKFCPVQQVKCQEWIDSRLRRVRVGTGEAVWFWLCWFVLLMPMVKIVADPLISYCCIGHKLCKSIFHVVPSIAPSNLVWWHCDVISMTYLTSHESILDSEVVQLSLCWFVLFMPNESWIDSWLRRIPHQILMRYLPESWINSGLKIYASRAGILGTYKKKEGGAPCMPVYHTTTIK